MLRSSVCVTLLLAGASGCQDAHKVVAERQTANMNNVVAILREVKDGETMAVAEAKLMKHAADFRETSRRAKALAPPDADAAGRLEPQRKLIETAFNEYAVEARRVRSLPGGPEFLRQIHEVIGGSP